MSCQPESSGLSSLGPVDLEREITGTLGKQAGLMGEDGRLFRKGRLRVFIGGRDLTKGQ